MNEAARLVEEHGSPQASANAVWALARENGWYRVGPLARVQAGNAVLGVAAPMCLLLMLFAATRIARFARLHPNGIG